MIIKQTVTQSSNGIGFVGLLTIVLIVLKLTGLINISWWMATVLMWAPTAIILAGVVLFGGLWLLLSMYSDHSRKQAAKRRMAQHAKR